VRASRPTTGLPVGLQIMAPAMADDRLYRVGAAVEAGLRRPVGTPPSRGGSAAVTPSPRVRLVLSLSTAAFSLDQRAARPSYRPRQRATRLAVIDGVVSSAAVVTGLLLAWRTLRNPDEDVA
jgi:hypothetical protein